MFVASIESKLSKCFSTNFYRKRNYSYKVGDFCFYDRTPIWVRLVCVYDGITEDGEPDFSFIDKEGVVVVDGTVKWRAEDLTANKGYNVGLIEGNKVGHITWQLYLLDDYIALNGDSLESASVEYNELLSFVQEKDLLTSDSSNKALFKYDNERDLLILPNYLDLCIVGGLNVEEQEAGLPNIKGGFQAPYIGAQNSLFSGAFYPGEYNFSWEGGSIKGGKCNFDASRSSSIYGKSNTVQPPAIKLIPQIKYKS